MTLSQSKKNRIVNYTMHFSAHQKKSIRKSIGMTGRVTKQIAKDHGFKSVDQFYQKHYNKGQNRKSKLRKLKKEKTASERKNKFHQYTGQTATMISHVVSRRRTHGKEPHAHHISLHQNSGQARGHW